MDIVKAEKLTKYYGRARGIVDVDLAVGRGEFFGFIGPNGAGKSTTIRILLGLISPTSGSATVFSKDVVKEKTAILQDVGYLPSEALYYRGMRVKDVINLSANLRKRDCSAEAKLLCERFRLDTSRKVDELSFGNRKKVAIVCALQHNPGLLVLDEPTGGLDPLMQKEFFDVLSERNKEGVTILLSSHILSEIRRNCTRAAIIRDGSIIACDSVEALSRTNVRRVTVRGSFDLTRLSNVRDVKNMSDSVSFLYGGDMNGLLCALSSGQVKDLTVTEPDLDEIFLHYYKKDGETR